MKNIILITTLLLFTIISCKKEIFPKVDDLAGSWVEQTGNSFKHRLKFENETLYFFKSAIIDTLSYRLDEKQELIILRLKNNSAAGESTHKILINKKKKELTIWGLFVGVNTSETVFKKE